MTKSDKISPSERREYALEQIANRLGNASTTDERYNNGFAHNELPGPNAWMRAFEEKHHKESRKINGTILDAVPIDDTPENWEKARKLVGRSLSVERSLFGDYMILTRWGEYFYQESPAINARARDDQVEIGTKGFAVPVITPFSSTMEE